jgi:hypothetical protein
MQLVAAMSAQIPSTSPLWPEIQSALGHGGPNGNSIGAVMSVLNRNNYTYDCGTNQLRDTSATPRPSPAAAAAAAGGAPAAPATTAPSSEVPPTGKTAAGSPGQAGSDTTVNGNTSAAAVTNAVASQPATGSSGGGDTLPIVLVLVFSTALVVFVAVRRFRKAA